MKKIKITQSGWEGFTGDFGGVEFEDGVSVSPVNPRDAARLANLVAVETEEGENPSTSQLVLDSRTVEMSSDMGDVAETAVSSSMAAKFYSREQLEEMLEQGGIAALRVVATPMGLKSNSGAQLIDKILAKQSPKPKAGEKAHGLIGTNKLGAEVTIAGLKFPLGDVVREAFLRSNMTHSEWNELDEDSRDKAIEDELARMQAANPAKEPVIEPSAEPVATQDEPKEPVVPETQPEAPVEPPKEPEGPKDGEPVQEPTKQEQGE